MSKVLAKGIQSVDTACRVLHILQRSTQPMSLKDIAAAAGMSASKTRMYLVSLLRTGLVSQNAASAYTLGLATLNLGLAAFRQIDLIDTTRALMASLTQETQAPTLLSMWTGTSITIISRNDNQVDLPIDFRIGGQTSLLHTATGHVFLAYLPPELTEAALLHELANTPVGAVMPLTLDSLKERTRVIREQGYDISSNIVLASGPRITLQGYGAIAAPVVDIFQELRFVITVLYRKTGDEQEALLIEKILTRIREGLPSPLRQPEPQVS
ncbi:IclR family transcriptional regulator [Pusillimonas noertemannii]|uniref:IclR family transcriptional regulator n=1 Tax=Pusillimonas noertemannii TaxID=305977 RepID=A0A2U1CNN2_9BURK|nr:helix-turn-helix domain-containing protein [Pusillimonas noertemannii]NYT68439.1 helix-turn-helix domain-containing protein [Pusillimonas noertemannii]PVY62544.1 IclR family transcriptional regulator [Pusillimonas noertemannii]